jgi:hypothetical protein
MKQVKRTLWAAAAALSALFALAPLVSAQAVTHAYNTDVSIQRGMIVRLSEKDSTKVEPLKAADIAHMEGVVVAANDAPVVLSAPDPNKQQIFVATTGTYEILVSNQNGSLKKDDYITISSLDGVGMKADTKQSRIIGKALESFDGQNNVIGKTSVKNTGGQTIPIALGMVAAEISISHNPLEQKPQSILPGFDTLQKVAGVVTDKQVGAVQLYLGLAVIIVAAFIAGSILYGGVRTALTAIGRNPLAKKTITRGLIQVVITSVIILVIGITAVYLILKL